MDTALYGQLRLPYSSFNRIPLKGFGGNTLYSLGENKVMFEINIDELNYPMDLYHIA